MKKKAADILEHIRHYCIDVQETLERFGKDKAVFETDKDFRNSVCMSLFQLGELTGHLPEDFRGATKATIYWPAIKGMRNLFAHNYGAIDIDRVWETALEDIPRLLEFYNKTIEMHRMMEQEAVQPEPDRGALKVNN